jgi:dTDP-4-amino-4,6-dideoxygalactose transaminase
MGARVPIVWYDIDPLTLQPVTDQLTSALSSEPCAVVVVHQFGIPVAIDGWRSVIASAGSVLIEDAAQGFGGTYEGRRLGASGDLGVLSFGRGKGVTGGRGGALVAGTAQGLALMATMTAPTTRNAGWRDVAAVAAQWALARPALFAVPARLPGLKLGQTVFKLPREPRLPSMASLAMLAHTWRTAELEADRRRSTALRLSTAVQRAPRLTTVGQGALGSSACLRLPLRAQQPEMRRAILETGRPLGVAWSYPQPLPALARSVGYGASAVGGTDGAALLASTLFTVPTHGKLTGDDVNRLERWIARIGGRESGG